MPSFGGNPANVVSTGTSTGNTGQAGKGGDVNNSGLTPPTLTSSTGNYTSGGGRVSFPASCATSATPFTQYTLLIPYTVKSKYNSSTEPATSADSEQQSPGLYYINIPLPRELQTGYRSEWQTMDLDLIGAAMDSGLGGVIEGIQGGITSSDTMIGKFLWAEGLKTIGNPYRSLEWKGPQQRSFSFTWDLNPTSAEDSDSLNEVIWAFKKYMHTPDAVYGSGKLYQPPLWKIMFKLKTGGTTGSDGDENGQNYNLFKLNFCALTSLDVDYTPRGHAFHKGTNAPLSARITAQFTEAIVLGGPDFGNSYTKGEIYF